MSQINKGDVYIIKDIHISDPLVEYRSEFVGKKVRVISVAEEGERFVVATVELLEGIEGHYAEGQVIPFFHVQLELKR